MKCLIRNKKMLPSFRIFVTKLACWTDIKLIEFCPVRLQSVLQPSTYQRNIELYSRELIYKLHVNRTRLLLTDLNNQRANHVVVPM